MSITQPPLQSEKPTVIRQWLTRELAILNILAIASIPVAAGMAWNEYKNFKNATENRLKILEDNRDKVKDDVNEIKYNVRYIAGVVEEMKKTADAKKTTR